ncbi:oligoendopeptidase F [Ferrimonas pelagia]|uniref:Oligopeptidase F n=1 Tax=Ferrimonas pelagia TaxID=1177826 RepID=A0ABP9FHR7_9GAMM
MSYKALALASGLALSSLACAQNAVQQPTPNPLNPLPVPTSHDWDLTPLYADWNQWQQDKDSIEAQLNRIGHYQGQLDQPGVLATVLPLWYQQGKALSRLSIYASLNADTDLRDSENGARRSEIRMLYNRYNQLTAYLRPELIAMGETAVTAQLAQDPALAPYRFPLQRILDASPHTLSPDNEALMAGTGVIRSGPMTSFSTFTNAELPWAEVEIDSKTIALTPAQYGQYRANEDRALRQTVFDTFFGSLSQYQRTLASLLNTHVNAQVFTAESRHFDNALSASLANEQVPEAVYRALVDTTNDNLDTFHRYLKLRARLLALDDQAYFDIYAPVVSTELSFGIETGIELMMDSLAPMGSDYQQRIATGLEQRWMDTYPKPGKRSGAYMSGRAYDVHPYVLMNYTDDFGSVSTLTHEWGHAIHSVYSNESQPYPTAGYATFVAEIASTLQEHLLVEHVLEHAQNDNERLFYLGQALDQIRGTYFRQTMFAEFELAIHQEVEGGKPLSDNRLSELFLDIQRRYHGHDQGVMTIDERYGVEWAYIPHFYYNFYVYQYATSIAASAQFAEQILSGDQAAYQRYLELLKAGGSDYPYQLVKQAGIDMAQPAPYLALIRRMNALMDQMEAILDKP